MAKRIGMIDCHQPVSITKKRMAGLGIVMHVRHWSMSPACHHADGLAKSLVGHCQKLIIHRNRQGTRNQAKA